LHTIIENIILIHLNVIKDETYCASHFFPKLCSVLLYMYVISVNITTRRHRSGNGDLLGMTFL